MNFLQRILKNRGKDKAKALEARFVDLKTNSATASDGQANVIREALLLLEESVKLGPSGEYLAENIRAYIISLVNTSKFTIPLVEPLINRISVSQKRDGAMLASPPRRL